MVSIAGLLPTPTSSLEDVSAVTSYAPFQPATYATMILSSVVEAAASSTVDPASSSVDVIMASATALADSGDYSVAENGECKLLGPFALFIQAALGGLALLSLVYKRWRERPRRPVKIWLFDVSKQVVGSILLHIVNLLMSSVSSDSLTATALSTSGYQANPCSYYMLNLAIDTTVGIPTLIILLRVLTHAFSLTPMGDPPESIESGNYGRPPKARWWLKQSVIYFIGLLGMKAFVYFLFAILPWLANVGDWALRWTEGNEKIQIFFVMLFFPLIMNAMQYYIIDSFIKGKEPPDHEPVLSEDNESDSLDRNGNSRRPGSGSINQDLGGAFDSDDDEETSKHKDKTLTSELKNESRSPSRSRVTKLKIDPRKLDEYNPATDGDSTPTTAVASSSNSTGEDDSQSGLGKHQTKDKSA